MDVLVTDGLGVEDNGVGVRVDVLVTDGLGGTGVGLVVFDELLLFVAPSSLFVTTTEFILSESVYSNSCDVVNFNVILQ